MWSHLAVSLLRDYGLPAMFAGVALESMGVPLPGETILVLATIAAAHTTHTTFWETWAVAAAAAVVGDNAGYLIGRYGGWPLLRRYGRWLRFDQRKMKVARYLFARRGGTVVFAGRFVALLRTTSAFLAGVNHMPWRRFLVCNAAGGVLWAGVWTGLAYSFGRHVHEISGAGHWAVVGAAIAGVLVVALVVRRHWRSLAVRAEAAYPGPL